MYTVHRVSLVKNTMRITVCGNNEFLPMRQLNQRPTVGSLGYSEAYLYTSNARFTIRLEFVVQSVADIFFVVQCVVVASVHVSGALQTQRADAVEIVETLVAVGSSTDASSTCLERQAAARTSSTD